MPDAQPDAPARLGMGSLPFVPLHVLSDQSPFAAEAASSFQAALDERLVYAVNYHDAGSECSFFGPDARTVPAHLDFLHALPPWWVWFIEWDGESVLPLGLTRSLATGSRSFHVAFIKLKGNAPLKLPELLKLPTERGIVFLLAETTTEIQRSCGELAIGAALYLIAAWRRFCATNDENYRESFLLPDSSVEFPFYTLGMGHVGPDIDYHAARWTDQLIEAVRLRWLREDGEVPVPDFLTGLDLVTLLSPKPEFLTLAGAVDPQGNEIVTGSEIVTLRYSEALPELPPRKLREPREHLYKVLAAVNEYYFNFRMNVVPLARQAIILRSRQLPAEISAKVQQYLVLPNVPHALFSSLKGMLIECSAHGQNLADSTVTSPQNNKPHDHIVKSRGSIPSVPNLAGGLLRFFLIVTALAWLIFGPVFLHWARGYATPDMIRGLIAPQPLHDPYVRDFMFCLLAGTLLLALAVAGWWLSPILRIWHLLDLAREAIVIRLLFQSSSLMAEKLREVGKDLLDHAKDWQLALEVLRNSFTLPPGKGSNLENRQPRFTDEAVDALLRDETDHWVGQTHQGFVGHLPTVESGLNTDPEAWKVCLMTTAAPLARQAIKALRFDALIDGLRLSPADKTRLLAGAVLSSRQPAFPTDIKAGSAALCVGPKDWDQFLGQYDLVKIHELHCCQLLVATPIEVLHLDK